MIALPDGWVQLERPDGRRMYSCDEGESVLEIAVLPWDAPRDRPMTSHVALLATLLRDVRLGRIVTSAEMKLAYGPALFAEVSGEETADAMAWLIVPAAGDVLLLTWLGNDTSSSQEVLDIVYALRA
jgi:hypothetical protein